jgi:uncharacterized protein YbjT (DUF2867 family)
VRVHVTGGSGFLGGHVLPLLQAAGHQVTGLARSGEAADVIAGLGAIPISGDLEDPASIDAAFTASGAEALVNLASLGFGHAGVIVAAAEEAGLRRAVFVSTTAIFTALPAGSKAVRLEAEKLIAASSLEWTIVRPTMIYGGPGDRNMARLLRLVRRAPLVPLPGGGQRLQQPVHVDDLAAAVVASLGVADSIGRCYDLGGPEAVTLRAVFDEAGAAVGRKPRVVAVPLGPAVAVARAYELVTRRPRLKAEQLARLAEDKSFDITAARRDLGFDPRPFSVGVRQEAALTR